MKRRSAVTTRPIEFLPKQLYVLLLPPPLTTIRSRSPDYLAPIDTLIFPQVPGIEFIELDDSILKPTSQEQQLDLAHTTRFCRFLNSVKERLAPKELSQGPSSARERRQRQVNFYVRAASDDDDNIRTTVVVHLLSRWRLLYLSLSPRDAMTPFNHLPCIYQQQSQRHFVSLFESLCMIAKGLRGPEPLIEHSDSVEAEDSLATNALTQITKRFFIFPGPVDTNNAGDTINTSNSEIRRTVTELLPTLKTLRVAMVVRLNTTPSYDDQVLIRNGIQHLDLSTSVSEHSQQLDVATITRFLECCENAKGVVAIHSSYGERAALCVACFLIKHAQLSAVEAVTWLQICRPQSIPNAHLSVVFLEQLQPTLWHDGNEYRRRVMTGVSGNAAINDDSLNHLTSQISIGKITLGRDSLLGKTTIKPTIPNVQQQKKEMAQRMVAIDLARRRPATQGAAAAITTNRRRADSQQPSQPQLRSRHSATEVTTDHHGVGSGSLRADYSVMHKFLHQSGGSTNKSNGARSTSTRHLSLRTSTTAPETRNTAGITF